MRPPHTHGNSEHLREVYRIQGRSQSEYFQIAFKKIISSWDIKSKMLITRCTHLFFYILYICVVDASSSNFILLNSPSLMSLVLNELSCGSLLEDKQRIKFGGIWWVWFYTLIYPWISPISDVNPQVWGCLRWSLSFCRTKPSIWQKEAQSMEISL